MTLADAQCCRAGRQAAATPGSGLAEIAEHAQQTRTGAERAAGPDVFIAKNKKPLRRLAEGAHKSQECTMILMLL